MEPTRRCAHISCGHIQIEIHSYVGTWSICASHGALVSLHEQVTETKVTEISRRKNKLQK